MKKAQLNQIFVYIFALVVIGGIILAGYSMISSLSKSKEATDIEVLKSGLKKDVQSAMAEYGNSRNFTKIISSKYKTICFADPSQNQTILNNPGLNPLNSIVKDSLESNSANNIFLIGDQIIAFKINDLRIAEPYYKCRENTGLITYVLEGRGSYVLLS